MSKINILRQMEKIGYKFNLSTDVKLLSYISCSSDPTTNYKTMSPDFDNFFDQLEIVFCQTQSKGLKNL